ncbi:MAG: NifB/NifX family molybdenum-iron cluster-binding protein [Candidatus Krumholzibacteriota bacterium]
MKLIISSEGPKPSDRVDPRFGRARYLLLYDSASESFISADNSEQVAAAQGAGVQAAQKVVGLGAEALLTGHCGPKAFQVLEEAGVTIYSGFEGTVLDAVKAWKNGILEPLAAPDGIARH